LKKIITWANAFLIAALFVSFSFYLVVPVSFSVPGFVSFSLTKIIVMAVILIYALKAVSGWKIAMPGAAIFVIITAFLGIISALFTEMRVENMKAAASFAAGTVIFAAVYDSLGEDPKIKKFAYAAIIAGGILEIAAAFFEYFAAARFDALFRIFRPSGTYDMILNVGHGNGLVHWDYDGILRVSGLLSNTNQLAAFLFVFLIFVGGVCSVKKLTGPALVAVLVLFAAGCQALVLTYSRAALVSLAAALILMTVLSFIYSPDGGQKKKVLLLTLVFALIMAWNMGCVKGVKNRFSDMSGGERANLQRAAVLMAGEQAGKSLLGVGYATYGRNIHNNPVYAIPGINQGMEALNTSPHSVYLSILLACGVTGLLSFIVFFIAVMIRLFRKTAAHSMEALAWLVILAGWAAMSLIGNELYAVEESAKFFAMAALAFYSGGKTTEQ
jgi:hypothetical protein